MDTLSDSDLISAAKQIYLTLKPGGSLIHFANLYPFLDTILTSHRSPDICFPWTDKNGLIGLRCISKENLDKNLSDIHRHFLPSEINFLREYSNLTASEREMTLNSIILDDVKTSNHFSQWVESLNLEGIKNLDNREFFERRTINALKEAGFEMLTAQLHGASLIKNKENDNDKSNYFTCRFGIRTNGKIHVLAPNKACYVAEMHVIIAQKKITQVTVRKPLYSEDEYLLLRRAVSFLDPEHKKNFFSKLEKKLGKERYHQFMEEFGELEDLSNTPSISDRLKRITDILETAARRRELESSKEGINSSSSPQ